MGHTSRRRTAREDRRQEEESGTWNGRHWDRKVYSPEVGLAPGEILRFERWRVTGIDVTQERPE